VYPWLGATFMLITSVDYHLVAVCTLAGPFPLHLQVLRVSKGCVEAKDEVAAVWASAGWLSLREQRIYIAECDGWGLPYQLVVRDNHRGRPLLSKRVVSSGHFHRCV
jgi:hypothetical protein